MPVILPFHPRKQLCLAIAKVSHISIITTITNDSLPVSMEVFVFCLMLV